MKDENVLIPAICPQCGAKIELSKNLEKGYCSFCGTEIVVKDAMKSVKIIGNPTFENYMKLANRAFEGEDFDKALDNYKLALEINPDDWLATYREGLCAAKITTLGKFDIDAAVRGSKNAIKIMEEDEALSKEEMLEAKLIMANDIVGLSVSFFQFAMNHYNEYWELEDSANEMWNRILAVRECSNYVVNELLNEQTIEDCSKLQKDSEAKKWKLLAMKQTINCDVCICIVRKYKSGYSEYGDIYSNTRIKDEIRNILVEEYDRYLQQIMINDPSYSAPEINRDGKAKGCYVATCVYGSYDCPEVWTLRRFRDNYLDKHLLGKVFIKVYYAISPKLISIFGNSKMFRRFNKCILDNWVKKLQEKGYENTKYDD